MKLCIRNVAVLLLWTVLYLAWLAISAVFGAFQIWPASIIFVLIAAFMLFFFRDPKRLIPDGDGLIVSAADGRVTRIEDGENTKLVSRKQSRRFGQ